MIVNEPYSPAIGESDRICLLVDEAPRLARVFVGLTAGYWEASPGNRLTPALDSPPPFLESYRPSFTQHGSSHWFGLPNTLRMSGRRKGEPSWHDG